jgi:hypothetical protein
MEIAKERVLELLCSRGDHDEADKAERELPDAVDPDRDAGLLTKFGVHPPELKAGL